MRVLQPPGGGPPGGGGAGCSGKCGDDIPYYYSEYYDGDNHIIETNHIPNHPYNKG